uniref:Trypsin-1-like n=1 Tax=Hirondellea gigas TaxID=1518452 RepID=A0A2P2HYZ9_9CRUS
MFEQCSWKFSTSSGSQLSLTCMSVHMSWFASIYITDGEKTIRHSCLWCTGENFAYDLVSTVVEVGLDNRFIFTNSGFTCRMEANGINVKDDCSCGVVSGGKRIVGGKETSPNKYPWVVSLVMASIKYNFCGGALITDSYVLTAAHCTANQKAGSLAIYLGMHNIADMRRSGGIKRRVKRIIQHPKYNETDNDYDIALVEIDRVDIFSAGSRMRPICLPSTNRDYEGTMGTVAGWGTVSDGGQSSEVLLEVEVPIISNYKCNSVYNMITDRMLCAGRKNTDSCQGDSGGALWVKAPGGHREVVGIVSFGYGCGKEGFSGVYARVTELLSWIISNTKRSTTCLPPK